MLERLAAIACRPDIGQPGLAGGGVTASGVLGEQPRLAFLELVHVALVVGQYRTGSLHVATTSELQREVDALVRACLLELGNLPG